MELTVLFLVLFSPLENLADEDTCTTISPITADEWETQVGEIICKASDL